MTQPTLLACASCCPDEDLCQMPLYVAHLTGPCELGTVHHSCPCGIIQYVILLGYPIRPLGTARALGHGAVLVMHMHSENTVSRPHIPLALGMEIFTRDHDQRACDSGPRHTGLLVVHLRSLTAAPVAPGRPIYVFSRSSAPPVGVRIP